MGNSFRDALLTSALTAALSIALAALGPAAASTSAGRRASASAGGEAEEPGRGERGVDCGGAEAVRTAMRRLSRRRRPGRRRDG